MRLRLVALLPFVCLLAFAAAPSNQGYYRFPAIHGNEIVFTSEGDLWRVGIEGGAAQRLTSHAGQETHAAFSPDGSTIAFSADYEGPTEVYTMPATGGLPVRRTFDGANAIVAGWTADGKIVYATRAFSTLPDTQLATIDDKNHVERIPLSQAASGCYGGATLFFTRQPFQGSSTKRYRGGTAEKLWKWTPGSEAVALTTDYDGTSKEAMWWKGRVYFLSDRDGTMNLWSMDENGRNLKQLTHHDGWDAQSASLGDGRIVHQAGADLYVYDIATAKDKLLPITLTSDFDQLRERWVKKPNEYGMNAHISWDGKSVILLSRGKLFVAPVKQGRFVDVSAHQWARYRDAQPTADGKSLIALSTESGEVEVWKVPANGVGAGERLTTDGHVLRWQALPSPDSKWVVHQDKDNNLWLLNVETKQQKKIMTADDQFGNSGPAFDGVRWSPDSRWISFTTSAPNTFDRIFLYSVETGAITPLTTDRYNSEDATWSPDGKWIYFLSDRNLKTSVMAPWGPRAPEPFFDRTMKVYEIALRKDERSPFEPADELHPEETPKPPEKPDAKKAEAKPAVPNIDIDLDGIAARINEVPAPPGNYTNLTANAKRLCWLNHDRAEPQKTALECFDIANKGDKPESITDFVQAYEMSGDGKKLFVRKKDVMYVFDSAIKAAALKDPKAVADATVNLKDWTFPIVPRDEYREMFADAWRLHRDYFYDPHMNGIDWRAMRAKYQPLVDRVRDREELSDLLAQMVGELSALHTFVAGGDIRHGEDQVHIAKLGALLDRDPAAGGYIVRHIYRSDPDRPDLRSPLAAPGVDVHEGDVITSIDGHSMTTDEPGEPLRNVAGKQVLLEVRAPGSTTARQVIVKAISDHEDADLRYAEWEYTRRLHVEDTGRGAIGYVHLRAMGPNDINQWAEQFYPVFDRAGLIIDVRHNGGGNIDSWLLSNLLRRAWFYWQARSGKPFWNMQYAFRGHMVVLCDEHTGSDGEAFTEGFRRLGLGKVIGTRTWGGEIWLSASNRLVDSGIATAAEMGVYSPDSKWLIEGHGVDPDITVDNLPNATFNGSDAQLDTAISYLKEEIKAKPVTVPKVPAYPNKSDWNRAAGARTTGR